jgi:hypothetical protein
MSTKSRKYLYGFSIRYSAEKGAAKYQCDGTVETWEELLTTFSFEGCPDTTHVEMNEAAPPCGQAAERRVFHLPQDTHARLSS